MFPIVRGSSSRTIGAGRGPASTRVDVDLGAAGDRDDAGARRLRDQLGEQLGARPASSAPASEPSRSGASSRASASELGGVRGHDLVDLGAEAQRVLEGVEPLEHRQARVAARGAESGDQRSLAAHLPIAAIDSGDAQPGPPLLGVEARRLGLPQELFEGDDEAAGRLELRHVADPLEDLEPAAGNRLMRVLAVADGDDRVIGAPDDQDGDRLGQVEAVGGVDALAAGADHGADGGEESGAAVGVVERGVVPRDLGNVGVGAQADRGQSLPTADPPPNPGPL